jgi:ABC-type transport system involved in cytochrome c biogenesis permease subunit
MTCNYIIFFHFLMNIFLVNFFFSTFIKLSPCCCTMKSYVKSLIQSNLVKWVSALVYWSVFSTCTPFQAYFSKSPIPKVSNNLFVCLVLYSILICIFSDYSQACFSDLQWSHMLKVLYSPTCLMWPFNGTFR